MNIEKGFKETVEIASGGGKVGQNLTTAYLKTRNISLLASYTSLQYYPTDFPHEQPWQHN